MNSDDIRFVRSAMLTDWEGICSIKVSFTTPQSGGIFSFCFPLDQFPLSTSETSKNGASARKKFGATAIGTRKGLQRSPTTTTREDLQCSTFSLTRMHSS